jgi:chromosome segregation ATPase
MKNKIPVTGFLLPTALVFGSLSLLYLLLNSASLSDIRAETEKEMSRQSELTSSLKSLREQIEPVRQELSDLKTEQTKLQDAKKASLEIIGRAEGLSNAIEQLRASESAATKRLDELQKSETKTTTRYESILKTISDEERKMEALKTQKAQSDARLTEALSKESAVNQRLSSAKQAIVLKEEELTGVTAQTQRLRTENADLTAKIGLARQDLRTMDAQLREKESLRQELEKAVAELINKKATAEAETKK